MKVIIFSLFSGTIGLSIYNYMAGSNISYLDLASPASDEVRCLTDWPLRSHAISWSPQEWVLWWANRVDGDSRTEHCPVQGVDHTSCRTVLAPVDDMKRPLALAIGEFNDVGTRYDVLGMWARFFLMITCFIWIGMTTHDLALIGPVEKDFILDVSGVNAHCPVIRSVWGCLAGHRPLVRLVSKQQWYLRMLGLSLAIALAPILIVWNVVVFNFVIVPLLLLAFARYPIRMSRAWVFIVCLACSIYGLALTALQLYYVASPRDRPRYAVTWRPEIPVAPNVTSLTVTSHCTCGCNYPVSFNVCINLTIVGVATTLKSLFVALRCLKGLRRSQWANLLSVVFPIPVTVYSVDWRQSNGQPIRHRSEGVAVQDEVAFDPFAMMDEQTDSALTTVHLRPEPVHTFRRAEGGTLTLVAPRRSMEMPSKPMACLPGLQVREAEYIGCCGFPWTTGGQQGVYDPEFIAQLDALTIEEATPKAQHLGRLSDADMTMAAVSRLEEILALMPKVELLEPHGCGTPGTKLAELRPLTRPRDHSPPRWGNEVCEVMASVVCCDLGNGKLSL